MKQKKEDALSSEMFNRKQNVEVHDDMASPLEKERDDIARSSYRFLMLRHGVEFEKDLSRAIIKSNGRTEYWRRIEDDGKKKSKEVMYEKVE